MARLLSILVVGLVFEAIGVVLLSRGLKEISSWFLASGDLSQAPSLVAKLQAEADPVSQFVWEKFTAAQQSKLSQPGPAADQQRTLVEALNRVLSSPDLYRSDRFAQVPISPQARELLSQNPEGDDLVHLNRLLLEDAYPANIARKPASASRIHDVLAVVGRGVTNARILFGVFFEALFFVALLILMSKAEVSFVWPLTSLSFVMTTFAAKIYLQEHVSLLRWSGVALIMLGAGLITWTEKHGSNVKPIAPAGASAAGSAAKQ